MVEKGAPVTALKGIGPRSAEELRSLGILTAEDLLRFFPGGYDRPEAVTDIAEAATDVPTAVRGILTTAPVNRGFGNRTVTSFSIADGSGRLGVAFFHMPYLKNALHKGDERVFRGVISETKYGLRMDHPKIFRPEEYDKLTHAIWPVYPTMGILSQKKLRDAIAQALETCEVQEEMLPPSLIGKGWMSEREALRQIHFPESEETLVRARERLVFEEFLVFLLRIRLMKAGESRENPCPMPEAALAERSCPC